MKIHTCLALVSLSVVVTGKSPRCTVSKWEVIQGFLVGSVHSGQGVETEGRALLSYDRDRQMINAVVDVHQGDKHRKDRYLYDYKNKKEYIIDEQAKCHTYSIDWPIETGCIPDGAKKVSNFYFGSANHPLNVDVYRLAAKGPANGYLTVVPTGATCIPVAEVFYDGGPNAEMMYYGFNNFTEGIKNATVFDIPPQCKGTLFPAPFRNMIPKLNLGRYVK